MLCNAMHFVFTMCNVAIYKHSIFQYKISIFPIKIPTFYKKVIQYKILTTEENMFVPDLIVIWTCWYIDININV